MSTAGGGGVGGDGGAGAGGTGVGTPLTDTVSVALACVDYGVDGEDDDRPFEGTSTVDQVNRCVYRRETQEISIDLRGQDGSSMGIAIVDFTGPGDYETDVAEAGTSLDVRSPGEAAAASWESDPAGSFVAHACTIRVVDTNLHEIQIPEGGETSGTIEIEVECALLGTAAVGPVECELSPVKFSFKIASCEAA